MSNLKQLLKMKTTRLLTAMALMMALSFNAFSQNEDDDKKRKNYGTYNDFGIDLGINNYLEDGKSPDESNALYSVKPFGSWYVALKSINNTHISGPVNLEWGGDISWYNFKFQNAAVILNEGPDGVEFSEVSGDFDPVKSKLTAAYVNVSLVPMLKFGESNRTRDKFDWCDWNHEGGFRIGAGGYAGYKIASYTKTVREMDGDDKKDKDKDGFYLNNFRYGVRMQMGYRGVDLFVNYDINELFAEGRGPKLNAFSFGVVL
ncbi:hypothetical protein E1176_15075 [Fulvivirga sp. RKSG066]|uniref:hypothetical protein n=1 Tax=Fulvivirga aurantia TaxID=2529383 RepID=UPI0012BCB47A|nr:hypothetical protein [Fulvivirga aurantia]MTI22353.1 hypothetical protein [Fulvivirga aurantia]